MRELVPSSRTDVRVKDGHLDRRTPTRYQRPSIDSQPASRESGEEIMASQPHWLDTQAAADASHSCHLLQRSLWTSKVHKNVRGVGFSKAVTSEWQRFDKCSDRCACTWRRVGIVGVNGDREHVVLGQVSSERRVTRADIDDWAANGLGSIGGMHPRERRPAGAEDQTGHDELLSPSERRAKKTQFVCHRSSSCQLSGDQHESASDLRWL